MCTLNKMIDSEQVTVQFHIDNLKVSHKNPDVLDDFFDELGNKVG